MKEHYPTKSGKYFSEVLNRKKQEIYKKACELKIKSSTQFDQDFSTYKVNTSQFLNPQTKEICYLLGILWADGYVTNNVTTYNKHRIQIGLEQSDFKSIEHIIDGTGAWTKITRDLSKRGWKTMCVAEIANKPINYFLKKHNYCSKHENATIAKIIPNNLLKYFYRGLLDGDGCIFIKSNKRGAVVGFYGPYEQDWTFMEELADRLDISKFGIYRRDHTLKGGKGKNSSF